MIYIITCEINAPLWNINLNVVDNSGIGLRIDVYSNHRNYNQWYSHIGDVIVVVVHEIVPNAPRKIRSGSSSNCT